MLTYADKIQHLSQEVRKGAEAPVGAEGPSPTGIFCSFQPQDSLPDVFVWLIHQNKRIAYHRFAARDLLFSTSGEDRGSLCGSVKSFYLKVRHAPRPVSDRVLS